MLPLVAVGVRGGDTVDDNTLLELVEQMAVTIRGGVALGVDFAVEDGVVMNDRGRNSVLLTKTRQFSSCIVSYHGFQLEYCTRKCNVLGSGTLSSR
jgi:hypothetical protein